jgi:hypothetical protein
MQQDKNEDLGSVLDPTRSSRQDLKPTFPTAQTSSPTYLVLLILYYQMKCKEHLNKVYTERVTKQILCYQPRGHSSVECSAQRC